MRRGRGFSYTDETGARVSDPEVVARISELAIPPAWTDVWICADELGHIQAVGTDAAGRRQYLYHQAWRERRDREKFERLPEFAAKLPAARRALAHDLELPGLVRERVLACAVRLLDVGLFRVGGEDYAEENESFGIATLERRHVRVSGGAIEFEYEAKGGIERKHKVQDDLVLPTVLALRRRRAGPDDPLLAYRTGEGGWRDVTSAEINDRIKELVGSDHSAKDFRTWNATVLAATLLAVRADAKRREAAVREVIDEVARHLGNTPAVCRDSYIDPRVFSRFRRRKTIRRSLDRLASAHARDEFAEHAAIERAVIRLLRGRARG